MSGFSADWLRLREPFDHQARHGAFSTPNLQAQAARWRSETGDPALSVVDLACGSGSNLRALAPRVGGVQHWRLIDHDPALLAAVPDAMADWALRHGHRHVMHERDQRGHGHMEIVGQGFHALITLAQIDLARDLDRVDLADTQLLSGAALLDLVSASWLQALVRQAREARAAMLFALNVDGRSAWTPHDAQDATLHELFEAHQLRDKGFGPALGAQAVPLAQRLMREAGYEVAEGESDWVIDAGSASADPLFDAPSMLGAMIEGIATAAREQAQAGSGDNRDASPKRDLAGAISSWQTRRQDLLPSTRLEVGHVDLFATLA